MRGLGIHARHMMVTTELQELIMYVPYLCTRWKLEGFNCACNRNCAILRLCTGAMPSRDCVNLVRDLRLACSFRILRMRCAISRLHKFLDCAKHIYWKGCQHNTGSQCQLEGSLHHSDGWMDGLLCVNFVRYTPYNFLYKQLIALYFS